MRQRASRLGASMAKLNWISPRLDCVLFSLTVVEEVRGEAETCREGVGSRGGRLGATMVTLNWTSPMLNCVLFRGTVVAAVGGAGHTGSEVCHHERYASDCLLACSDVIVGRPESEDPDDDYTLLDPN